MKADQRAIKLKEQGLTIKEVVLCLKEEGFVTKTGRPFGFYRVQKWTAGIASQRGYRNPLLSHIKTKEDMEIHKKKQREKQLKRLRQWRANNPNYQKHYLASLNEYKYERRN